jgi:hypothetical protein
LTTEAPSKLPLRERAINEAKELTVLTFYLFIVIATINLQKAAVLHTYSIDAAYWGVNIVKAALLAKFIALGRALKVGEHKAQNALIWPTMHKAFAFLIFLVCLTLIEEIIVGFFHHRTIVESMVDVFGPRLWESLASILMLLLVLIPYFAFEVLAEALGEHRLVRMFFVDRNAAGRK